MTRGPPCSHWNCNEEMCSLEIQLQLRVVLLDQITPRVPGFNGSYRIFYYPMNTEGQKRPMAPKLSLLSAVGTRNLVGQYIKIEPAPNGQA